MLNKYAVCWVVSATLGHRRILPSSSVVCSVCCRGFCCTWSQTYTARQLCGVRCVIAVSITLGLIRTLPGSSAVCSLCRRGVYCTRSQTYNVWQLCGVFAVSTALSHRCSLPGSSAVCWVVSATLGHRRTLPGSSAVCSMCRRCVCCTRSQTYNVWQLCAVTVDCLCLSVSLLSLN